MPQLFNEGDRYPAGPLENYVAALIEGVGVPREDAVLTSRTLVEANLRGVDSHGVSRVGIYIERMRLGVAKATTQLTVISDSGACALLDGGNGVGQVAAFRAMSLAIAKAREYGSGWVGVRNNNHIGALAYYTLMASEHGMMGFAAANGGASMAPWGSKTPFFGPNPFSVAIPGLKEEPIVVDMATSVVARGNIILAAKQGMKIPLGWASDVDGRPTEDPKEALAGLVLPMGGYKGNAIAMVIDILVGVLTGGAFGPGVRNLYKDLDRPHEGGNLFGVIDIGRFIPLEIFRRRIDEMVGAIHACDLAEGVDRIYVPGEIENNRKLERLAQGIPLDAEVVNELRKLGEEMGISFPEPVKKRG
jgi:LDH2 family malate/lactate/ureidoglycolate dehydrogenase